MEETDVYRSERDASEDARCGLPEVEARGPEDTKLLQSHGCGQGVVRKRGVLAPVIKGGSVVWEKAMAPHSSTLAWKIPWTEEPGRLQFMGLLRVGNH